MRARCLAIIPARGGSKRIPRKNVKEFLGKPIIHYSITAALQAGIFDEVMVSTDEQEIAAISRSLGANVPFMRSEKNSNDFAITADVIFEVLSEYGKRSQTFDFVCCVYPTAPFVNADKLKQAYELLVKTGAQSVIPITKFGFPIMRSMKIEDGLVRMNWPEHMNTRSQDLPPAYHDCGQFYFLEVRSFLKNRKLFTDNTVPVIIPESEVQDIDNEEDWKIAEIKYMFLIQKQSGRV